ncbi:MAG: aminopeptidase P family protein [Chloroflexi bacterium]|nr:aminopeptidase P family protein [Chloroflexota bacterium]
MAHDRQRHMDRWARAQAKMVDHHLDLLLVAPGSDFRYLLGQPGHASPRLTLLALPAVGQPALLAGALEMPGYNAWGDGLTLLPWQDGQDPIDVLRRAFAPVSLSAIGVSDRLWATFLLRLQDAYRASRWVSAAPVLRELRRVKDESELARLREAGQRTDLVWQQFLTEPLAGMTERQAAARLEALLAAQGMPPSFDTCVAAGPHGASPHHTPGERVIMAGEAVVCDFGGVLDGYCSDITRTVHVGPPSERFATIYAIVKRAHEAAFKAIKPGVRCEEIDSAARWVIDAAGFGDRFIHRTGHGLGLDIHEEPYLVGGNTLPVQVGMVFSDEPGIYLPGEFGVRIEDCVIVTADGAERLTTVSRDLTVVA